MVETTKKYKFPDDTWIAMSIQTIEQRLGNADTTDKEDLLAIEMVDEPNSPNQEGVKVVVGNDNVPKDGNGQKLSGFGENRSSQNVEDVQENLLEPLIAYTLTSDIIKSRVSFKEDDVIHGSPDVQLYFLIKLYKAGLLRFEKE